MYEMLLNFIYLYILKTIFYFQGKSSPDSVRRCMNLVYSLKSLWLLDMISMWCVDWGVILLKWFYLFNDSITETVIKFNSKKMYLIVITICVIYLVTQIYVRNIYIFLYSLHPHYSQVIVFCFLTWFVTHLRITF